MSRINRFQLQSFLNVFFVLHFHTFLITVNRGKTELGSDLIKFGIRRGLWVKSCLVCVTNTSHTCTQASYFTNWIRMRARPKFKANVLGKNYTYRMFLIICYWLVTFNCEIQRRTGEVSFRIKKSKCKKKPEPRTKRSLNSSSKQRKKFIRFIQSADNHHILALSHSHLD